MAGKGSPVFLFDVDGLLVNSHELQAQALLSCVREQDVDSNLDQFEISKILVGGTEESALRALSKLLPKVDLKQLMKRCYEVYEGLLTLETLPIDDSVTLLRAVNDIGFRVMLVSNSKRSIIERYCRILNLGFLCNGEHIICIDDCPEPKPSPALYNLAMERMSVPVADCIVFEDSPSGIIAGKAAGAYVVARKTAIVDASELFRAGADEVVTSLLDVQRIKEVVYRVSKSIHWKHVTTKTISVQDLSLTEQDQLVSQTFAIYCKNFNGRDIAQWRNKVCDKRDFLTRIGLIYEAGNIVGYGILKFQKVSFRGEERYIVLSSSGALSSARSGGLIMQIFQREQRRALLLTGAAKKITLLDNFLGPAGYTVAARAFKVVYPSQAFPKPPSDTYDFMMAMATRLGYRKADVADPHIYHSSSTLKNAVFDLSTLNSAGKYIMTRVGPNPGLGLYSAAEVTWDNMLPLYNPMTSEQSRL